MTESNNDLISPANQFLLEKGIDCENYIIIDATGHYKGQIPIATWLEEFAELTNEQQDRVSQQRELLLAYDKWDEANCYKLRYLNLQQRIDIFLKQKHKI